MAKAKPSARSSFLQMKEALESILFALILAFVFRGFVGQAFVIPTGSMAPTLLGKHIDHICSNCGYGYAVGTDQGIFPRVKCPNCDWEDVLTSMPVRAEGDGIFTLSWPFALGGPFDPQRWDVIVFKAPFNLQVDEKTGLPVERDGQTNYIKRLVGMPGDVIQIIDGDIYTCRAAEVPEPIRAKLAHTPLPEPLSEQERHDLDRLLKIQPKPHKAQQALWQVVFDADYPPTKKTTPGWKPVAPAAGWTVADKNTLNRILRFAGTDSQPQFIQLEGKNFADTYGYNSRLSLDIGQRRRIVSDLQLSCTATWQGQDGTLQLQLSKRDQIYTVELNPKAGTGRTIRRPLDNNQPEEVIDTWSFRPWKRRWPVNLAFQNVDHQLQVWMDDRQVWQGSLTAAPPTAAWAKGQLAAHRPEQIGPPVARIGAADLQVELAHVAVMRDVFYGDDVAIETYEHPSKPVKIYNEYTDQRGWATRDNPLLLRDDEYFMLGDNSPASYDSRRWWQAGGHLTDRGYRVGTVPADQLVGKAFFVYWPSWYELFGLRIVPNIGEMRWIQ